MQHFSRCMALHLENIFDSLASHAAQSDKYVCRLLTRLMGSVDLINRP